MAALHPEPLRDLPAQAHILAQAHPSSSLTQTPLVLRSLPQQDRNPTSPRGHRAFPAGIICSELLAPSLYSLSLLMALCSSLSLRSCCPTSPHGIFWCLPGFLIMSSGHPFSPGTLICSSCPTGHQHFSSLPLPRVKRGVGSPPLPPPILLPFLESAGHLVSQGGTRGQRHAPSLPCLPSSISLNHSL